MTKEPERTRVRLCRDAILVSIASIERAQYVLNEFPSKPSPGLPISPQSRSLAQPAGHDDDNASPAHATSHGYGTVPHPATGLPLKECTLAVTLLQSFLINGSACLLSGLSIYRTTRRDGVMTVEYEESLQN